MATLLGGVALALIHIVENQPIKSRLAMYKPLIRFNSCLKQTYISHTSVIEVDAVDVCVCTYQGVQKKSWFGLQINGFRLLYNFEGGNFRGLDSKNFLRIYF